MSLCYQFVAKILERSIFNEMLPFLIIQASSLEIPVVTHFCQLRMRYTNRVIMGLMLEMFS